MKAFHKHITTIYTTCNVFKQGLSLLHFKRKKGLKTLNTICNIQLLLISVLVRFFGENVMNLNKFCKYWDNDALQLNTETTDFTIHVANKRQTWRRYSQARI